MKETRMAVWEALIRETEKMMKDDDTIVMYTDAEELFHKNFNYYYSLVVDKFMKIKGENLDRHKVAAVIICAILKSDVLGIASGENSRQCINGIFLANEKLAVNIALSDMYQRLKKEYEDGTIPYEGIFENYIFPKPLSCDREYTEVICRDLHFAKKHFELNPLSIANFLFLLEAYSFEVSDLTIDHTKWEQMKQLRQGTQNEKELKNITSLLENFDIRMEAERNELETKKAELEKQMGISK